MTSSVFDGTTYSNDVITPSKMSEFVWIFLLWLLNVELNNRVNFYKNRFTGTVFSRKRRIWCNFEKLMTSLRRQKCRNSSDPFAARFYCYTEKLCRFLENLIVWNPLFQIYVILSDFGPTAVKRNAVNDVTLVRQFFLWTSEYPIYCSMKFQVSSTSVSSSTLNTKHVL